VYGSGVADTKHGAPSPSGSPSPNPSPTPSLPTAIGAGEGELDIVIWPGYAEDGSNAKEYDWVHPFERETACKVKSKVADTSDDMFTLMTQNHGLYDGVSASGDASNRLIDSGEIAPINPALVPNWNDITPFLQNISANTVNGVHYGVSHGWGGNLLMYRTDKITTAPTSWDAVFDPAKMDAYKGKVTAYNGTIYMADAALYLKTKRPELAITDPYELNKKQFDAAVSLLKKQRPLIKKYWVYASDEVQLFKGRRALEGATSIRGQVLGLIHGGDRQLHERNLDDRDDLAIPDELAAHRESPGSREERDPHRGHDGLVGYLDALQVRQASQLHDEVAGVHGPPRGPDAGRRVLR